MVGTYGARHLRGGLDCLLQVLFDKVDEFRDFLTCFSKTKVYRSKMHFNVKFHTSRHLLFRL